MWRVCGGKINWIIIFTIMIDLGIQVPVISEDWELLPYDIQQSILLYWENIRGMIPDRIKVRKMASILNRLSFLTNLILNAPANLMEKSLTSLPSLTTLWLWFRNKSREQQKKSICKTYSRVTKLSHSLLSIFYKSF